MRRRKFDIKGLGFTAFLGGLSAIPALAIDMALPSLSLIQADFGATQTEAAAAIAVFLAGFSTAPLAIGPLADRYGRKPVMLAGLGIFAFCALGCALAPSIGALLAFRLIQGGGAGAVGILPRAIIRDLFEGRDARLQLAAVTIVFSVAPLVAPTLGAGILAVGHWRLIYVALAAVGAALGLMGLALFTESHGVERRRSLMPASVAASYRQALTNRMCAGFALVNGLVFAGLFAYVNTSPLLFIEGYGVSRTAFGGLFALTASGVIFGSLISTWLMRRHAPPRAVLDAALALVSLAALVLLAVSLAGFRSPLFVVAPAMVYIASFGLVVPNAVYEALHPLPEIAGVASAVLLAVQMLFGALGGATAAALYRDGSPLSIGLVMSAGALGAAALYALWLRPGIEE